MRPIPLLFVPCFALLLGGCDWAGLEDNAASLLAPEPTSLDAPGVRIVKGSFHDVRQIGAVAEKVQLLARVTENDGDHLRLLQIDWGAARQKASEKNAVASCDLGLVTQLWVAQSSFYFDVDATVIAVFTDADGDGFGSLRFVDSECRELTPPLQEFEWASFETFSNSETYERRYFGRTATGDFVELFRDGMEPRVHQTGVVAQTRSSSELDAEYFWLLVEGEILQWEVATSTVTRGTGSGVTSMRRLGGDFLLYTDDSGLGVWNEVFPASHIAQDGCAPIMPDSANPTLILFFAPCAERRLNATYLYRSLDAPWRGPVVEDELLAAKSYLDEEHAEFLLVTGKRNEAAHRDAPVEGSLHTARFAVDPEHAGGEFTLDLLDERVLFDGISVRRGFDGKSGDYYALPASGFVAALEGSPLARKVVALPFRRVNYDLFASDFDGKSAVLELIPQDVARRFGAPQQLDVRVLGYPEPAQIVGQHVFNHGYLPGVSQTTKRAAFVSADGAKGSLRLLTSTADGVTITKPLVENVLPRSPVPLLYLDAIAYLSNDATRTLSAYLEGPGFEQSIHAHVSEFFELESPLYGLVYVVDQGDDAGIWFSKTR